MRLIDTGLTIWAKHLKANLYAVNLQQMLACVVKKIHAHPRLHLKRLRYSEFSIDSFGSAWPFFAIIRLRLV
jgi:hypothetical protein